MDSKLNRIFGIYWLGMVSPMEMQRQTDMLVAWEKEQEAKARP